MVKEKEVIQTDCFNICLQYAVNGTDLTKQQMAVCNALSNSSHDQHRIARYK
jgi:hypothetical protein